MKTSIKSRVVSVTKNGRTLNALVANRPPLFWFDSLALAGMIRVTACGEENVYFEFSADNGEVYNGYCKCL